MSSENLAPRHWQPERSIEAEESFMTESLARLGQAMRQYPLPEEKYGRLVTAPRLYVPEGAELTSPTLPPGEWDVGQTVPTAEERADLESSGLARDSWGRPLHPWLPRMLRDPDIGTLTGKGRLYHWGENEAADPVVIINGHVLLILRDNGQMAFPGGFVDFGEDSQAAAMREGGEEANLDPATLPEPTPVYKGPVADPRMTAHAWITTTAYLFKLPDMPTLPAIQAGDDALAADWVPIENARQMPLYGSHNLILEEAIRLDPSLASETACP